MLTNSTEQAKLYCNCFIKLPALNSRQALDMAQKLSHQLRVADDRIAGLEAEVRTYRERAERAEQWLHKVYTEIEDRFMRQVDSGRSHERANRERFR
jgi:hypothetical protein